MDALYPMETAPKDGSEVVLQVKLRAGIPGKYLVGHYMPGGHCIEDHPPIESGWYFWNGHMFDRAAEPVGWMPIPGEEYKFPVIETTGLRPVARYVTERGQWQCSRPDAPEVIGEGNTSSEAYQKWLSKQEFRQCP
jgi:hypothetical protein